MNEPPPLLPIQRGLALGAGSDARVDDARVDADAVADSLDDDAGRGGRGGVRGSTALLCSSSYRLGRILI